MVDRVSGGVCYWGGGWGWRGRDGGRGGGGGGGSKIILEVRILTINNTFFF